LKPFDGGGVNCKRRTWGRQIWHGAFEGKTWAETEQTRCPRVSS
jgi:hypothetical protein